MDTLNSHLLQITCQNPIHSTATQNPVASATNNLYVQGPWLSAKFRNWMFREKPTICCWKSALLQTRHKLRFCSETCKWHTAVSSQNIVHATPQYNMHINACDTSSFASAFSRCTLLMLSMNISISSIFTKPNWQQDENHKHPDIWAEGLDSNRHHHDSHKNQIAILVLRSLIWGAVAHGSCAS